MFEPRASLHARRRTPCGAHLALLAALLLAAALRWSDPRLIEFKYDEAHIAGQALDLARGGALLLLTGGTSLGIPRGPLDVYGLALALKLLNGRIEAAIWLTGSLGVLAGALAAAHRRAGRLAHGRQSLAGVLRSEIVGAHPGRLQRCAAAAGLAGDRGRPTPRGLLVPRDRRAATAGARAGALAGPELAGRLLSAPRRWWTARRQLGWGLAAGLALLGPYLWALGHSPDRSTPIIAAAPPTAPTDLLGSAGRLLSGGGLHVLAALPRNTSPIWQLTVDLALPLALLAGIGGVLRTAVGLTTSRRGPGGRLLLAWTIVPTLLLLFGPLRPPLQYWTVLLPLPALYTALGIEWIARGAAALIGRLTAGRDDRREAFVWGLVMAPMLLLAGIWTASFAHLTAAVRAGAGAATFGPPLER